jgi:hypothetical protein
MHVFTSTMKQRITYVVKDPDSFTPELLDVKKDGSRDTFAISGVQAAKEHRITLGLDELPTEVHFTSKLVQDVARWIFIADTA